jgi:hypothetical protein
MGPDIPPQPGIQEFVDPGRLAISGRRGGFVFPEGGGVGPAGMLASVGVEEVLQMAVGRRQPSPGLLYHSDRGSQYAGPDYQPCYRLMSSSVD